MNTEKQILLLRAAYLKKIRVLYTQKFRMKLIVVCSQDKKWYELHLHNIDVISSIIEHTIMENNPRRTMRYLYLLSISIKELIQKTEIDYAKYLNTMIDFPHK